MKKKFLMIFSLILIMALVFALPSCKKNNKAPLESDTGSTNINGNVDSTDNNSDASVSPKDENENNDLKDENNNDSDNTDNSNDDNSNDDNSNDDNSNDDNDGLNNDGDNVKPVVDTAPVRNGKEVTFGLYPQVEVYDTDIIMVLNGAAGSWSSDNGMWYADVDNGGLKYRGVKTSESGEASWFKYEPIVWTVLEEKDGNALILCDMIIDAREYAASSNNYADSTIRAWLNSNFINTAFSELQAEFILTTEVDNKNSTGYPNPRFTCDNTNDKVFLLSRADVKNTAYGFTVDGSVSDAVRQKIATAYAISQINGVYDATNGAWWWLRTPAPHATDAQRADLAHTVKVNGTINNAVVSTATGGVVPAMWISFSTAA